MELLTWEFVFSVLSVGGLKTDSEIIVDSEATIEKLFVLIVTLLFALIQKLVHQIHTPCAPIQETFALIRTPHANDSETPAQKLRHLIKGHHSHSAMAWRGRALEHFPQTHPYAPAARGLWSSQDDCVHRASSKCLGRAWLELYIRRVKPRHTLLERHCKVLCKGRVIVRIPSCFAVARSSVEDQASFSWPWLAPSKMSLLRFYCGS